ncbi:MAG: hypothetical protein BV458_13355 [Thermoplasmata archaeon M9B2D]|nr:MAG: hypothetical protein BV458_13355 [Thermoplasmata archaeon M9B2D]
MLLNLHKEPLDTDEPLPITLLNGLASQGIPVPTLYAIRYLSSELESALETLVESTQLQEFLCQRGEEKEEIHARLLRIMKLFQEFLMVDARR